jgi:hypothetical protein
MKLRYLIISLIVFYKSILGVAAQDCEVTLNMATEEFNTGHFFGVPALLNPCLEEGQNREWRQRAYLLLTQTYLLLDDPIGAKNSYLKVLEANPEYVPNAERDPIDLVYFSSKFTTAPIFSLFAYTGPNVSQENVLVVSTDAVTTNPAAVSPMSKKYSVRMGYQFGVGGEWHYDENLSVTAELNFLRSAYKKTTKQFFERDEIEIIDRQNWVRVPIAIKFSDHVGKYRPYGYIGFSIDYLLSDKAMITTTNNDLKSDGSIISQPPSESPLQDFSSKRNRVNQSVFIGGGLKYKMGLNYAFVDVRYSVGMKNLVAENHVYYQYDGEDKTSDSFLSKGDPTTSMGHVDDLFRMNNLIISIGYIHPLYKPRELKRAKTKSVLKRIKKQDDK